MYCIWVVNRHGLCWRYARKKRDAYFPHSFKSHFEDHALGRVNGDCSRNDEWVGEDGIVGDGFHLYHRD